MGVTFLDLFLKALQYAREIRLETVKLGWSKLMKD